MANFTGTPDDDSLTGTSGDDAMVGLAGNDTIVGLGGADFIHGGLGNDSLVGGDDATWDTVSYEAGLGTSGAVHVNLGAGFASGADGDDVLVGFERVIGSDFDDTLIGSTGSNDLEGRAGNDSIVGGGGNDKAFYWITSGSGVGVHVSLADGRAYQDGWGGVDTLVGISQIVSSLYNDTLVGNAADNMFRTYTGNDSINGGAGLDQVVYDFSETAVNVNLSASTGTATGKSYTQSGVTLHGTDTLEGIELVVGSNHNDTLTGSTRDTFEMFEGGKGNDTIDGGAITTANNGNRASYQNANGSVTVDLQSGTATGADGSDKLININQIRGSNSADSLYGSNASAYTEFFEGRGGNDFIDGRGGTDVVRYDAATGPVNVDLAGLDGGARGGAADGQGGFDTLVGIEGIQGTAYNDTLIGGHAQGGVVLTDGLIEFFRGGAGNDTIDGRQGYDRADYDTSTAGVHVDLGADTVNGRGAAHDGLGGNDTLINIEAVRGSSHNDTLIGSDAYFESFEGGAGNDTINGNGGWDRLDYRFLATSGVNVSMADGIASDGQGGTDTFSGIERVRGGAFNDTIVGDGGNNQLEGVGDNDSLSGAGGNDTLYGGDGSDTLRGGDGDDQFRGGAGNDVIDGGNGANDIVEYWDATAAVNVSLLSGRTTADGQGGADTLSGIENVGGSNFNDTILGDANNNSIWSGNGADSIDGGAGNDNIQGGMGNDVLKGGDGWDWVNHWDAAAGVDVNLGTGRATGGAGSDTLSGFEAVGGSNYNDTITGDANNNSFAGGLGNDSIVGGGGRDQVGYWGATEAVTVDLTSGSATGADGSDTLVGISDIAGSSFGDALIGNTADNSLDGGAGNDTINGGSGADWLSGGSGNDVIFGEAGADILLGGAGNDTIDGGAVNRIDYLDSNVLSYEFDQVGANGEGVIVNLSGITGDGTAGQGTATDGWGGTDTLTNINFVRGSSGNDSILGSTANIFEQLEGGAGNDTLDGGVMTIVDGIATNGNRVSYQNALGAVMVDLQAGIATVGVYTDTLSNFNQIRGSNQGDSLYGSETTDYAELFDGRGGNDTIDGRGGFDIARYDLSPATGGVNVNLQSGIAADGQGGTDFLQNIEGIYGTSYNDTLVGNEGNNRLEGRGGNDSINGGLGKDTLLGGSGSDTLDGGEGVDAAGFQYAYNEYAITRVNDTDLRLVRGSDTTILRNVEYLGFSSGADVRTLQDILGNTPSDYSDTLTGTAGDDSLSAGKGNDSVSGLAGNDALSGGEGNDTLVGGLGDDVYVVDTLNDVITEAADEGEDSVQVALASGSYALGDHVENATVVSSGAVGLVGNALANQLVGNAVANTLSGNDGNDLLQGLAGNDTLSGGNGGDTLDGGVGTDRLVGGIGDDTYKVDATGDVIVELAGQGMDSVEVRLTTGTYTLSGGVENATVMNALNVNVMGSGDNNVLTGGAGNNVLNGMAGNDTLVGGLGNDTLDGGTGTDLAVFDGAFADYTISRPTATDIKLVRGGQTIIVRGVESFQFTDGVKTLGDVTGNTPSTLADTLEGTAGDDSIDGLAGNDSISGLGGNDTLVGGLGSDTLVGGLGDDTYTVDALTDAVVEASGEGTDLVNVSMASGAYTLGNHVENGTVIGTGGAGITGNALDNVLTGNTAANTLTGGGGNDTLDGGAGSDRLIGGDGDDTYKVDATGDVIVELAGQGMDSVEVRLTTGTYTLSGGVENATVMNALNVNVTGSGDNNVLTGGAGNNVLNGMAGNDTLVGGLGNDTLTGGAGADTFVFDAAFGPSNQDRITDFVTAQGDKIALSAAVFTQLGAAGTPVVLGGDYLQYSTVTGALTYDADGVGGAGAVTLVVLGTTTHPALTVADFVLIA